MVDSITAQYFNRVQPGKFHSYSYNFVLISGTPFLLYDGDGEDEAVGGVGEGLARVAC